MADWLSEKSVVALRVVLKVWERRERSQSASLAAYVAATYSLSVVYKEIISCRLADQETAPMCNKKAYSEIAWRSSAMSRLPYTPMISSFFFPPYDLLYPFDVGKSV